MNMKGPSNARYKTMMCKHFNTEEGCQYGEKCQFAHGATDLRGQELNNTGGNRNNQQQKSMMNYKIVKCKNFEKEGQCKYGNHCTFAHGDNELRSKTDSMVGGMGMGSNPQQNPMMPYQQYMYDYMMMNQMQMGNMPGVGGFPQMPVDYSQGDPNMYMMMNMPTDMNMNNMNLNNPMGGAINKVDQSNQK